LAVEGLAVEGPATSGESIVRISDSGKRSFDSTEDGTIRGVVCEDVL